MKQAFHYLFNFKIFSNLFCSKELIVTLKKLQKIREKISTKQIVSKGTANLFRIRLLQKIWCNVQMLIFFTARNTRQCSNVDYFREFVSLLTDIGHESAVVLPAQPFLFVPAGRPALQRALAVPVAGLPQRPVQPHHGLRHHQADTGQKIRVPVSSFRKKKNRKIFFLNVPLSSFRKKNAKNFFRKFFFTTGTRRTSCGATSTTSATASWDTPPSGRYGPKNSCAGA